MESGDAAGNYRRDEPNINVSIREHLEALTRERVARFQALLDAHDAVHIQESNARGEASKRIDARLEALNELRSEVITDRGRFLTRETFDIKLEAVEGRIDALHDQITEWKGREKGLSLTTSIIVGAAGFVATVLAIYFALNG